MDLGKQPICNAFLDSSDQMEAFYPLRLGRCKDCSLVQLMDIVPREIVFGKDFNYLSGSSKDVKKHYWELADYISLQYQRPKILEIASNDGTFLERAKANGCKVLGIDPAPQATKISLEKGIPTITGYFEDADFDFTPDVICAFDVFGHAENIHPMLSRIRDLMALETTLIIQNQYLPSMIEAGSWDTIYHEHLRYFDLYSFSKLLAQYGLEIHHYEINNFYGGSFIAYCKIGKSPAFFKQTNPKELRDFVFWARNNSVLLKSELVRKKESEKSTVGVGAPMKSSTLLNYCKIGPDLLDYLTEVNHLKVGKYSPGMKIPVVEENRIFEDQPDMALILSWNMKDSIMKKLREGGFKGDFMIPIPEPRIIKCEEILV